MSVIHADHGAVGVVTWCGSDNFGTNLQAYALVAELGAMGRDAFLLHPGGFHPALRERAFNAARRAYHALRPIPSPKPRVSAFVRDHIPTKVIRTRDDYEYLLGEVTTFVSGGDQIWNPNYLRDFFLLDFASGRRRIAYGTSIGVEEIPKRMWARYHRLLSPYAAIGMREDAGVREISRLVDGTEVRRVADPVFLLPACHWSSLAARADIGIGLPDRYVLCYLVGSRSEYPAQVRALLEAAGVGTVVVIPSAENPGFTTGTEIRVPDAGPLEFLRLVEDASLVVTDSFHATALCVILGRPFAEFVRFAHDDSASQNSRILELLERCGQGGRLCDEGVPCDVDWLEPPDAPMTFWSDITESASFLERALEG